MPCFACELHPLVTTVVPATLEVAAGRRSVVCAQPFLDEGSPIARFFPPKELATAAPIYVGTTVLSIIVFNIGWSLIAAHPVFQRKKNEEWLKKQS